MKIKKETKIKSNILSDNDINRVPVFYFLPLLIIAGFIPLIVYAKYVNLEGTTQSLYWTGQQQYIDFFSYWKSFWLITLTSIALIFYIVLIKLKKLPFKNLKIYYIPLVIYGIFIIFSTIFSADYQTALLGFVDMYQGMFVLLSYVIISFLTINFVNSERDINLFAKAFLFLMIAEGILGLGQYIGLDFFQTKIGGDLIIPNRLMIRDLSFSFGTKTIYGTLFNTNFVGSFSTLMLPISIALLLGFKTKKSKFISGVSVILMIITWIGCNSRAGYIGISISFLFGILLFRQLIKAHWKICLIAIALILIVAIIFNGISNGMILNKIKSLNPINEFERIKVIKESPMQFEDILLDKDSITIKTSLAILKLKVDEDKLYFLDENNYELSITNDGREILINDSRYKRFKIYIPKEYPGITVKVANYWKFETINFYITDEGIKVLGSGGRITEPIVADKFTYLDGYELLASNRGYIWGRSIPLLSDYLLFGSGPDNYPLVFPQDDFVHKLNIGMDANMVVDKPHNMYLQIAINTGVLSLLTLLVLWFSYIIDSIKLYSKVVYNSLDKYVGSACLISVIGYLSAGMFNDHIVSVSPLFWLIFGLGISINQRLKKQFDV